MCFITARRLNNCAVKIIVFIIPDTSVMEGIKGLGLINFLRIPNKRDNNPIFKFVQHSILLRLNSIGH